eukprot:CAMPEP_0180530038 /NCGR_PEP_ID=MMETSP1036_2-20121128/61703_1 /TAXON_ID=632150 /ORGANISM="Azadinium spinosum, Strain 3D9" /LENGTH=161 /DNA_ID=CAMNT_0022543807 /DNA_START=76 /DNA_END=562 /DNA_ORIENTATION=-
MAAETGAAGGIASTAVGASVAVCIGGDIITTADTGEVPEPPCAAAHETMPWTPPRQGGELECPGAPLRRSRAATASDDEPECRRQKRCSNFFADEEMRPAEPRTPLRSRPREASSSGVAPQDGLLATPPPIKRHSAAVELGLDDTKGSEMPPLDAVPLLPM